MSWKKPLSFLLASPNEEEPLPRAGRGGHCPDQRQGGGENKKPLVGATPAATCPLEHPVPRAGLRFAMKLWEEGRGDHPHHPAAKLLRTEQSSTGCSWGPARPGRERHRTARPCFSWEQATPCPPPGTAAWRWEGEMKPGAAKRLAVFIALSIYPPGDLVAIKAFLSCSPWDSSRAGGEISKALVRDSLIS